MDSKEYEIKVDYKDALSVIPLLKVAQKANDLGLEGRQINNIRVIGDFGKGIRVIFKTSERIRII